MAFRFVSSVLLCWVLAVGCGSAASPASTGGSPAAATAGASPEVSPANRASPTAAETVPDIASNGPITAGTYRLKLAGAPTVLDPSFPALLITVPDGWSGIGGWALHRNSQVAVQFWNVDQVYGHPCKWTGTLSRPGPTVDDLVKGLADRPLRHATKPTDVNLAGYQGKYLEWSVPSDADFSKCDADGGTHYFESGTAHGGQGDRYHQGPGQVDRLWILDVNGARVVIDAFSMPSATDAQRHELVDVVESIKFER